MSAAYRLKLEQYHGPLDLLLYLVRRAEVAVVDLPVAQITSQFLSFVELLKTLDLDEIGDFIVLASTLIELKSRQVLPNSDDTEEQVPVQDEARSELITRLMEYKRYKDAALVLEDRAAQSHLRFPRLADERPETGRDFAADRIREVELWDLVSALSRLLQKKMVEETSSIRYDDTPISVHVDRIAEQVQRVGRVVFSDLFEGSSERSRIIGVFLAILELLRHHGYRAEQPEAYGDIFILPPIEALAPPAP